MKALCAGCAKKAVYCTKCKGLSAKGVKEDENERCKACGWVMCDPDCKGACATCEEGTLRPLEWKKCSRKPCGQQWAETTKWCASCGRCSLKKCAGKISVCKEESCKQGQPPKPCQLAVGGKQRLPAKHYHCANCIKMATDIMKCPVCESPCECSKCTTCSAGNCCNFGSAKECKFDDCTKQVCRNCVSARACVCVCVCARVCTCARRCTWRACSCSCASGRSVRLGGAASRKSNVAEFQRDMRA